MSEPANEPIHVIVAMDFSDDLIKRLRAVSPRLVVERHFPKVSDRVWENVEILYTYNRLPTPEQAPRLRWIQLHTAGLDHMTDHPMMTAEDVTITTASGVHAVQMSEYCLMMMLAFAYKLPTMLHLQAKGQWQTKEDNMLTPRDLFAPRTLRGQTLGIVGYGSIGRELARMADALGMTVLASKRDVMRPADTDGYAEAGTGDPEGDIPARLYPQEAVVSMVSECDFVVVTLPLTATTHHAINGDVLAAMKPNAVFINVGRGGVVDETALVHALNGKKIAGAALDVFEEEPLPAGSPLWSLPNVIISPHVSGNSVDYHEKAAALFIENLQRYLDGEPPLNRVRREHGY